MEQTKSEVEIESDAIENTKQFETIWREVASQNSQKCNIKKQDNKHKFIKKVDADKNFIKEVGRNRKLESIWKQFQDIGAQVHQHIQN